MERRYWLRRKRASLAMARNATTAESRLIHFDLAGRYSVQAAHRVDASPLEKTSERMAAKGAPALAEDQPSTILSDNIVITESQLKTLIPVFYARVREDALIGPVFNASIADWDEHLERLVSFWSSVMLTSGRYKGSPVAAHLKHGSVITPPMFDRWLALWAEATEDLLSPVVAAALQDKAARIAESLKLALFFRLPPAPRTSTSAPSGALGAPDS